MSRSSFVHVAVEQIVHVTDKALLVQVDGERVWLPKSHVSEANKYEKGDANLTVSVSAWIANQKGLECQDG